MTVPAESRFVITNARSFLEHVPEDLSVMVLTSRPPAGPTARICAVGDIGLSGRGAATARRLGADTLFVDVAPLLRAADVTFGNLESPFAGGIAPDEMFSAPTAGAEALHAAGFNLLHLANNHVADYGQAGLTSTLAAVRAAGMTALGAGDDPLSARRVVRTDTCGLRIGWLGCGRTLEPQKGAGPSYWEFDEQELLGAVGEARKTLDVLVVSIHIGLMYLDYPRPDHKRMAERFMAAGADLIVMHHAHVLQGVQTTPSGRVCCYNLGNFTWDWQEGNVQTPVVLNLQNEGAIFLFDLDRNGVAAARAVPILIDEACRVRWATGEGGLNIFKRLARISLDLEGDFKPAFEAQRASRNTGTILKVLMFHARRGNWRFVMESLRRARWEHFRMMLRWMTGRFPRASS